MSQGRAENACDQGFLVTLMGSGADTQGNIHSYQVRTLDWRARKASFKEKAPTDIVQHVLACISAVGRVERDMMVKNEYMAVVT